MTSRPHCLCLAGLSFLATLPLLMGQAPNSTAPQGSVGAAGAALRSPYNRTFVKYLDRLRRHERPVLRTQGGLSLGLIPEPIDLSHLALQPVPPWLTAEQIPRRFDLRDTGRVTPVRDQGQCGSCWAFATLGSLESILAPAEVRDFSENNLKNRHGFDNPPCEGGNALMSIAYMARWGGPVSESADPYQPLNTDTSPPNLPAQKHLQEVLMLPGRDSALDRTALKSAVMTFGALQTSMYFDVENSYRPSTAAYYYHGTSDPEQLDPTQFHGVTLVGWDDDYDRFNFLDTPAGDGAFLVKDSHGASFGQNGYLWISYHDTVYPRATSYAYIDAEEATNYTRKYEYDPLGWVSNFGYSTETAWFANVFTAADRELLRAVAFYSASNNSSYRVDIYTDADGGPTSGTLAATTTGTFTFAGYHTVVLPKSITLAGGMKFAAVVKLTTPGYQYPVAIERVVEGYSSAATAAAGQSYVSRDGTKWADVISLDSTANACLKAFTATAAAAGAELSVGKSHAGDFTQGQQGAGYTVSVSNRSGAGATSGTVTVTDTMPQGLGLVSMNGSGWTCSGSTCTRSDSLAGGSSYPPITVKVNVASDAPSKVTNRVTVSGGGSSSAEASDVTGILQATAAVRIGPADGLPYVRIPAGSFAMGCVPGDAACFDSERPRHEVRISTALWMGRTEVTVGAYERFSQAQGRSMPPAPENYHVQFNPGWQLRDHPIVNVNHGDAAAFCAWAGGRLPTEAEWEYAARGGQDGLVYPRGNTITHEEANYGADSGPEPLEQGRDQWRFTAPVGSFPANASGLYDMAGNVEEWTGDRYDATYYGRSPRVDPPGPEGGAFFVVRGGGWWSPPRELRASHRTQAFDGRYGFIGFRCVQPEPAADTSPRIETVVNGASFGSGPIAPGEIVTITGELMGPEEGLGPVMAEGRLGTALADVSVTFGGVAGPLLFVREDQINVQVPYSVQGKPSVDVVVAYGGRTSGPLPAPVAQAAPALFMWLARQAIVLHADGTLVGAASPAKPGEIVVFWGTGEGQTDPGGIDGKLADAPYPKPVLPVSLTIGGRAAEILYAGCAPGLAGVFQVNAKVPVDVAVGENIPVVLAVGTAKSPPDVYLTVGAGHTPAPTVTLRADPASIHPGGSATLSWSSSNATSASIDQGIGDVPVNGSLKVSPASTTVYTITVRGDGGQASASATVTVTAPPQPRPAEMINPPPDSTLAGSSVTFQWNAGSGIDEYRLRVGNGVDTGDIYDGSQAQHLSVTVSGIPTDGRTIYVRLYSRAGQEWYHNDYTYKAATVQASDFVISNLRIGSLTRSSVQTRLTILVDFTDPSGTAYCGMLQRDILITSDAGPLRSVHSTGGVQIGGRPCLTSGTLDFGFTLVAGAFPAGSTLTIQISLVNAAGMHSNELTGQFRVD